MQDQNGIFHAENFGDVYDLHNYAGGLSGWVLRTSHKLVEKPLGPRVHLPRVVEVGAGTGIHFNYIRHTFSEYVMTDSSNEMLDAARRRHKGRKIPGLKFEIQNAAKLTWADETADRLIAAHVLEHVPSPHLLLDEWWRVIKPGGVLSLVLPCDPGVLWRVGRSMGPRSRATKNGYAYDYVMALEHINAITNLRAIIAYKFGEHRKKSVWWPIGIGITDLNLIYCVNIWK